ncbi:hypothetical protein ACSW9O_15280 (plasmid) [Clostridium perfringens]
MTIINLLELRNKKQQKNNLDDLINNKLNKLVDGLFRDELRKEQMWVYKIAYSSSEKNKKQKIDDLKTIEQKYFNLSKNFKNKLDLLKCFAMLSNEYELRLVDFIKENLIEVLEKGKIGEVIFTLEELNGNTKEINKFINYLYDIREGKKQIKIDTGGSIPSYRDTQSSISIGGRYNFQQA